MVSRIQEWAAEQWFNGPDGGTPITADRLDRIEEQVEGITLDLNALPSADVLDEHVRDVVNASIAQGANVTVVVNDAADTVTIGSPLSVISDEVDNIKVLTQAAYDALTPKAATTLYVIVG